MYRDKKNARCVDSVEAGMWRCDAVGYVRNEEDTTVNNNKKIILGRKKT